MMPMDLLLNDIRFGARLLWKDKAFAVTAVSTLAICIGVNAAVFSVVHSVVLKPLPFSNPDEILLMYNSYPGAGVERASNGVPDYYDRLRDTTVFEELALYDNPELSVGEAGSVQQVQGMGVTPSFFRILRVQPRLGRIFSEEEGEPGKQRKVILSYAFWQELFGGDASVLGRDIRIYGNPYVIVGVMPRDFLYLDPRVRLYRPLAFTPEQRADDRRHNNSWEMIGRLKRGATLAQAQAQIDAINAANLERFPHFKEILTNARFRTQVIRLHDEVVKGIRRTLYLLWGGAGFVLLIGIINVANLAVARGSVRMKELATRFSLGAGGWRVTCQLLSESALLASASAALGLLLGYWGLILLRRLHIERIPRGGEIGMDGTTVLYALGSSVVAGIAIAVIPVAQGLRVNLGSVFREDMRTASGGRGARALRNGLVVAQVAFALVLLMGAGLLIASFRQVLAIRPGFTPEQVVTGSVALPAVRYKDDTALRVFAQRAMEGIRALPGVLEAGATNTIPFGSSFNDSVILAEGYVMKPGESMISGDNMSVTPGYFETMRIPLIEGRFFDERDSQDAQRVIILDERLARKFWPEGRIAGKRMWRPTTSDAFQDPAKGRQFFTIVGVVGSVKLRALVGAEERIGSYYFPYAQNTDSGLTFAVRTAADTGAMISAMRRVISGLDPELPFYDTRTMIERIDDSLTGRRSPMFLGMCFGAVALILAGIGIYGVLAYLVAQRRKEIGIRMALGGNSRRIFRLVFTEGALITLLGFALGGAGIWLLSRYIESVLYGVRPLDPLVIACVGLILAAVAALACALPARRATLVDPILALRQE
jgi:predicted permease